MGNLKNKDEKYWKKKLSSDKYKILREKGTEPAFTGELLDNKKTGMYACAACEAPLFSSDKKYNSRSGWPSFWEAVGESSIELAEDNSLGMNRTEVICANCGSHLGHLFEDGPKPTGARYCINSASLSFKKVDK